MMVSIVICLDFLYLLVPATYENELKISNRKHEKEKEYPYIRTARSHTGIRVHLRSKISIPKIPPA